MKTNEFVELNAQELDSVNGGHIPSSWYMNDATIAANGNNMATFFGFFAGLLESLVS